MKMLKVMADCILIAALFVTFCHRFLDARVGLTKIILWSLTFTYVKSVVPQIISSAITFLLNHIIRQMEDDENEHINYFSEGASKAAIDALPTKTYSTKGSNFEDDKGIGHLNVICCICLDKYVEGDCIKELLCLHNFHIDCVDKWLQISATCPLCKHIIQTPPFVRDVNTDISIYP